MKRFVALALLASLTVLAVADTAEARRCRRRCGSSCHQVSQCATSGCQSGGCQSGYAHAYQDPNMGVQHSSVQPGQPQYAPAPPRPAQPAQAQPNTTYFRGAQDNDLQQPIRSDASQQFRGTMSDGVRTDQQSGPVSTGNAARLPIDDLNDRNPTND